MQMSRNRVRWCAPECNSQQKGRWPVGTQMPFYPKPSLRGNAEIVARIAKLTPRLASNHDGEIIATVAAIRRTLEGGGFDLNDLAGAVASSGLGAALVPAAMPFVPPDWSVLVQDCAQHRD